MHDNLKLKNKRVISLYQTMLKIKTIEIIYETNLVEFVHNKNSTYLQLLQK